MRRFHDKRKEVIKGKTEQLKNNQSINKRPHSLITAGGNATKILNMILIDPIDNCKWTAKAFRQKTFVQQGRLESSRFKINSGDVLYSGPSL